MSKQSCCCHEPESKSSGFIFGVILGAIIGAVIAIIIYKQQKSEVIEILKKRLNDFIDTLKKEYHSTTEDKPNPTRKTKIIDEPIIKSSNLETKNNTDLETSSVIESVPVLEDDFLSTSKIKKPKTFVRPKK